MFDFSEKLHRFISSRKLKNQLFFQIFIDKLNYYDCFHLNFQNCNIQIFNLLHNAQIIFLETKIVIKKN